MSKWVSVEGLLSLGLLLSLLLEFGYFEAFPLFDYLLSLFHFGSDVLAGHVFVYELLLEVLRLLYGLVVLGLGLLQSYAIGLLLVGNHILQALGAESRQSFLRAKPTHSTLAIPEALHRLPRDIRITQVLYGGCYGVSKSNRLLCVERPHPTLHIANITVLSTHPLRSNTSLSKPVVRRPSLALLGNSKSLDGGFVLRAQPHDFVVSMLYLRLVVVDFLTLGA